MVWNNFLSSFYEPTIDKKPHKNNDLISCVSYL